MKLINDIKHQESGFVLIVVLLIASFLIVLAGGLASVGIYQDRLFNQEVAKHEALHMAEAGVNYYRWHLAHNQTDFMDGTGADPGGGGAPYGPYQHAYSAASSNNVSGKFILLITPPPTGSTIVTINSTGWLDSFPNTKRTIEVKYGIPSLAHYSFLTNNSVWFGNTEHVVGELHSNSGIRMDGTNDSVIRSARQNFDCPAGFGCNNQASCNPPCTWHSTSNSCNCPGIFGSGPNSSLWTYPVTAIPFNTISIDLNNIENDTLPGYTFNTNGSNKGWHITFKSTGHFDARLVSAVNNGISQLADDWNITQKSCQNQGCSWNNGCFCSVAETIKTQGSATDYALPTNGLIFINNGDAWVDGTVSGRVTLGAGTFPENANKWRSIYINGNLQYLARDGNNSLGLIAQKDIKIPRDTLPCNTTDSKLIIDGILLAQNGRVFRNYYSSHTKCYSIEVYGGIITNQTWTWSWNEPVDDGYINTNSIYDPTVTYSPPPSFPTSGEYAFISWDEK